MPADGLNGSGEDRPNWPLDRPDRSAGAGQEAQAYARVQTATGTSRRSGRDAALALSLVVAGIWLLVALQRGVDTRQLLIAAAAVAAVNVVVAIVAQTLTTRERK